MTTTDPAAEPSADIRSALALVVSAALRAEGWKTIPPRSCYAVADALLLRPGMLRAATDPQAVSAARAVVPDTL